MMIHVAHKAKRRGPRSLHGAEVRSPTVAQAEVVAPRERRSRGVHDVAKAVAEEVGLGMYTRLLIDVHTRGAREHGVRDGRTGTVRAP